MEVAQYLYEKGIETKTRGYELIVNCPFCDDTQWKGAININNGAYNCLHLNTCGVKCSWWDFQKKLGDEPRRLINDPFINQYKRHYQKPKPQVKKIDTEVDKYLKSRGFTAETIKYFRIAQKNRAIAIPYFKNKETVNVKYRPLDKTQSMWTEKNAEPTLFNRDNITKNELIITEGEYDCMALYQYGIEAVSLPNGVNGLTWIDNEWDWLRKFKTISLCLDNDPAGTEGTQKIAQKLGAWRCKKITLPAKDANDCLKNGITKDEILQCILEAEDFQPATLVSPTHFINDVIDYIKNPLKLHGIPTAWDKLTEKLKGWRLEELTVWSGRNSSGKSTILNQHVISLAANGMKSCIASLEMPPSRYLRWAIMQFLGTAFPTEQEVKETLELFDAKIYIVNTHEEIKPNDLLDIFEYATRRHDVKHFIIDSLMRIAFQGRDELKEHKAFVSDLLSFVKKFKCHAHLVAHPRKGFKDSDKPGKVDIMGTGHISDLAHNVIIMWRAPEDAKEKARTEGKEVFDTLMDVQKNREFGIEGGIRLWFDPETKTFDDTKSRRDEQI